MMRLTDAKKLLVETLKEKESLHYALGWLSNSYYAPQDDITEAYVITKTLNKYGIDIDIEGVV